MVSTGLWFGADPASTQAVSIAATKSKNVDINIKGLKSCKLILEATWDGGASATSGLTITSFHGTGPADSTATGGVPAKVGTQGDTAAGAGAGTSVAKFDTEGEDVAFPAVAETTVTVRKYIVFSDPTLINAPWERLQITNDDTAKAVSIKFFAEI